VVVGVESTFNWYWLADVCAKHQIEFVLGHANYMKAVHQGKTKNDRIDGEKISRLLAGRLFPQAYVYPREMRASRDLLRRRLYHVRERAALKAHIALVNMQYNLDSLGDTVSSKKKRNTVMEHFNDHDVRCSIESDIVTIDHYDVLISKLEKYLEKRALVHNKKIFELLQTIPGIGKILALTLLYEIHQIERFPRVQQFCSYARVVTGKKTSDGKPVGSEKRKIGNPYLKWAFSEAVVQMLKNEEEVGKRYKKMQGKYGKARALSRLTHRLARVVYYMWKNNEEFNIEKYLRF
jgi:transposase